MSDNNAARIDEEEIKIIVIVTYIYSFIWKQEKKCIDKYTIMNLDRESPIAILRVMIQWIVFPFGLQ